MILILQRVQEAKILINEKVTSEIGAGILAFVCIEPADTDLVIHRSISKILALRIFDDQEKKMNLNLSQVKGGLLLVSQFTLAADTKRGNRPGFSQAALPAQAKLLFDSLVDHAEQAYADVQSGEFGADMQIHLINDGPVTIPIHIK